MEKKAAKIPSSFEYESDILDEITAASNIIAEIFENCPELEKFVKSAEEIAHFCRKTYEKNILLLQKTDEFNAVIVNNAVKINTMLKIINSDNENILGLKEQYDKNLNILKTTQQTIAHSKELYQKLRKTVSELNEKVQKEGLFMTGDDVSLSELVNDVTNLKQETAKAESESKELKQQIKKTKDELSSYEKANIKLKEDSTSLESSLSNYEKQSGLIKDVASSAYDEIIRVKKIIKERKQIIEEQKKSSAEKNGCIHKLNGEKYTHLSTLSGLHDATKTLKEKNLRKTKFLTELQNKAQIKKEEEGNMEVKLTQSCSDIVELSEKSAALDKQIIESQEKYAYEVEMSKGVVEMKGELRKKVRDLRTEYIKQEYGLSQTENEINQDKRKRISCENQIQTDKGHIETQKKVTKEVIDQGKNVRSETISLKEDLQTVKEKILSLYDEVDEQKTLVMQLENKTRIQESIIKQIDQQAEYHQKELEEYHLKQENQEALSEKMRKERNYLKRVCISLSQENEELTEQISQLKKLKVQLEHESNEYTDKIVKDHEVSVTASNWSTFAEEENAHYRESTLGVERIISRLQTQRQTLDFILNSTQQDYIQQQKEQNLSLSNIELIRKDIHKRKTNEADLRSDILTLERNIDKAKHMYDEKVKFMMEKYKELDSLKQKTKVLEERKDKLKQKKFIYHRIQSEILFQKQKYSALVHEFSIPRNVHRWAVIEAIDPAYASQLRYRAAIAGKLDFAHQLLITLTKEKDQLSSEIEAMNAKLEGALTKEEVQKRISLYEKDIRDKEEMLKNMRDQIGGNKSVMNRSISNIDTIRVKITEKRGTTASLRSRSNLATMKLRKFDNVEQNREGWFLTEAPAAIPFASGYIPREAPQERTVVTQSDLQINANEPKSFRDRRVPLLTATKRIAKPLTPHFGKSFHIPRI